MGFTQPLLYVTQEVMQYAGTYVKQESEGVFFVWLSPSMKKARNGWTSASGMRD